MTGGQYSVVRMLSGLVLVFAFVQAPLPFALAGFACIAFFMIGAFHRVAASALALLLAALTVGQPTDGRLLALVALALHAALPPKPYGTLAMRGDVDPGSKWRFPRIALIPLWAATGLALAAHWHWALAVIPLVALMPAMRPIAWLALLLAGFGRMFTIGLDVPGWWLVVLLMFEADFVKPKRATQDEVIFYDGACGLCHGFIRFVLSEDSTGAFKFAPLQSDTFTTKVPEDVRKTLPDSVVVATADGRVLSRSAAVMHVLNRLGGLWGVAGRVASVMPQPALDAVYDRIAAIRYKLFKKPTDACPMMPKELRARFLY